MLFTQKIIDSFPFLQSLVFTLPLWYWLSLIIAIFFSLLISRIIKIPLSNLIAFFFRQKNSDKDLFIEQLKWPIYFFISVFIFLFISSFIKIPNADESTKYITIKLAIFLSFTHLFYRLIDLVFAKWIRSYQNERSKIGLVLPLGRRLAKMTLLIIAILIILSHFGVDVSALLVGLGVGGFAVALAAQKILENLFGGAVLSLDQPFQVGDYCKCGDVLGYIEEIGVRSTRIRTLDRTLVSIPNSKLAEMHIENYMEREKIRLYTIIKISMNTPLATLKEFLSECEQMLVANENFYKEHFRIRLIAVGEMGYEVEFYAFCKSTDFSEFVRIREDLLFNILQKMHDSNIKLSVPSRNNILPQA